MIDLRACALYSQVVLPDLKYGNKDIVVFLAEEFVEEHEGDAAQNAAVAALHNVAGQRQ